MQQQQQQQLLQQQQPQSPHQVQQPPQLIGSGTITVATNAPNLADIFNHQELLAQIQQMDSSFAKTFPDFAEKTIEKEMRAMQQVRSSLHKLEKLNWIKKLTTFFLIIDDVVRHDSGIITEMSFLNIHIGRRSFFGRCY